MEEQHEQNHTQKPVGITRLTVCGFKSIRQECSIDIAPLTILAGANSSGKSSMLQPLLLIKQTLEAPFDPGALLLNGPNVQFTSANQLLSKSNKRSSHNAFTFGISVDEHYPVVIHFRRQPKAGFNVEKMITHYPRITFKEGLSHKAIEKKLPAPIRKICDELYEQKDYTLAVERERSFLTIRLLDAGEDFVSHSERKETIGDFTLSPAIREASFIYSTIHLPGLRGNPTRSYPMTAIGPSFPGTFEKYAASVIATWQAEGDTEKIQRLRQHLQQLYLASHIQANLLNDTQIELRVRSYSEYGENNNDADTVNIADVGVGVSQTLPILVALIVARHGQLVYIEQPEIHLHPRALLGLAAILADAAERGVRVVVETHSALLILAIQTLVAEGRYAPELLKLHWFTLEDGVTKITSTGLDRSGAFTEEWPEDFGSIEMSIQNRYLSASEAVQMEEMA